jgi:arylsulfatase A-like enzyme
MIMKTPNVLLAVLALAGSLHAEHYQVYLLGGQSNANGRADAAQLTTPLSTPQTDVRFYWHRSQTVSNVGHIPEDTWTDLAPGSGHGNGAPVYAKEFGSEVSFGRAMADAKPTRKIAIIKYSHGGTNLHTDWAAGGIRYTTFVSTVQTALSALTTEGHTYELSGMLWQQGEADASGTATDADNYQTNLTSLISRIRTDLNGGVPFSFVLGSLSNSQFGDITTVGSNSYKVRQAQEAVAAADPTVGIVITDGYSTRVGDTIHFNHDAQVTLGQSYASQMIALEGPAPNIIMIMVDDLGYGDVYCLHQKFRDNGQGGGVAGDGIINGTEEAFIYTPNLDRMAAEGAKLTRHYTSAPVCAPARGSLLQGRDQGHANIRNNDFDKNISDNHTLGTLLKDAGYYTATVGKWGVGGTSATDPGVPTKRGFDYFYGYIRHSHGHQHYPGNAGTVYEGIGNGSTPLAITSGLDNAYTTDLWTAKAKQIIQDRTANNPNTPFFLYLAYDAPHAQLQVPTQAYPAGSGTGGGLTWPLNTNSGTNNSYIHPDYSGLSNAAARHATMVRRIDNCIGDILQTLRDLNIDENTLVVFTSDNGTHDEPGIGGSVAHDPRNFDSYGFLEGIKRDTWEGGIRMPTFAWWPGQIGDNNQATPALESTRPSAFWDWMPTFADAAGATPPAWSNGVSLLPELTATGTQQDKGYLYFEYQNNSSTPSYADFPVHGGATRGEMQAIFMEDPADGKNYKGIRYNISSHSDNFLIYDVDADPGEATNLAGSKAALQQMMKDRVLQVRTDGDYSRSYLSSELAPPAPPASSVNGLDYKAYTGNWSWVPETDYLTPIVSGTATHLDLSKRTRDDDILLEFTGYISVPTDGTYTFQMTTDSSVGTNASGGMLWIHDAHIIDDDFNHDGSAQSGSMHLQAGLHPIRVLYKHSAGSHDINLKYSGPGITLQDVPTASFFRSTLQTLTAVDDSALTYTDQSILIDVLDNDTDDGQPSPISIQNVGTPDFGTAAAESGQIRYTPPASFEGTAQFTYTITDGEGTDSATVTVAVTTAQPPLASNDEAETTGNNSDAGTPVLIPVLANDSDPDSGPQPLFIDSVGTPEGGSVAISGQQLLYTPSTAYFGVDNFTYSVSDGVFITTAWASVQVNNQPPAGLTAYWDFENHLTEKVGSTAGTASGSAAATGEALSPTGANSLIMPASGSVLDTNTNGGLGGTKSFTVLAFINTSTTVNATIFNYSPSSGSTGGADLRLFVQANGDLRFEMSDGAGFDLGGDWDLGDGTTHLVAAVFDSSTGDSFRDVDLYVDGTLYNITGGTDHTIDLGSGEIFFGRDHISESNRPYVGRIDDVSIFNRALSLAELDEMASKGVLPELKVYSSWAANTASGLAPENRDFDADPDGDTIKNGLENIFGTNPSSYSRGMQAESVNGNTFAFNHPLNPSPADDLSFFYRWSPDLFTFIPEGQSFNGSTVTFNQGEAVDDIVTVVASVTGTPLDKLFVDIEVVRQ